MPRNPPKQGSGHFGSLCKKTFWVAKDETIQTLQARIEKLEQARIDLKEYEQELTPTDKNWMNAYKAALKSIPSFAKAEQDRLAAEKEERDRREREERDRRAKAEQDRREKAERDRLAQEAAEKAKAEQNRLAAEQAAEAARAARDQQKLKKDYVYTCEEENSCITCLGADPKCSACGGTGKRKVTICAGSLSRKDVEKRKGYSTGIYLEAYRELWGQRDNDDLWERRRLAGCGLSNDHEAPHGLFILAPILMILMMVYFMYRKPLVEIKNYLSGSRSEKPSSGGVRNIRKKAPVRHF